MAVFRRSVTYGFQLLWWNTESQPATLDLDRALDGARRMGDSPSPCQRRGRATPLISRQIARH
jgi:hypothetical protein